MLAHRGVGCSGGWCQQLREQHRLRCWRTIAKGAVGPEVVVLLTPVSDQDLRLKQGGKAFTVKEFVSELAVERLYVTVFPGTSRLDKERLDCQASEPVLDGLGTELRAVVRTDVLRRTPTDKEFAEGLEHVGGVELPVDDDSQTLPGVLVDYGKHPKCSSFGGSIGDEVIRPDMVGMFRSEADARAVIQPQPFSFRLLGGHFKAFLTPDPLDPLTVHPPACAFEQGRDPAVAVASVLGRQLDDGNR